MRQLQLKDLPLHELEAIDATCDAYSSALRSDNSPSMEEYVSRVPERLRLLLVVELVELDREFRRVGGGDPSLDQYCQRFPQWADAICSYMDQPAPKTAKKPSSIEIPGYEIRGEIGRGGMGVVYKARQINLDRIVALKMAITEGDGSHGELDRFRNEAESVARLHHPNIVQIFEIGEAGGKSYFTMEFVEGGSLAQHKDSSEFDWIDAAQLIELLARAIAYAHEKGIIHRDLKPSNVLLQRSLSSTDGSSAKLANAAPSSTSRGSTIRKQSRDVAGWMPKITDFGLARKLDVDQTRTLSGIILGTPQYMAPEQASGRSSNVGPAADIYSLGAILYELLTGRPPFRGANMIETLDQVRSCEAVAPRLLQPKIPRDLETICVKCLQKQPEKRYGDASQLADDLERFIGGLPITARPVSTIERSWRWAKRKPAMACLLSSMALLLIALIVVPSMLVVRLNRARAEAERRAIQSQSRLVGMRVEAGTSSSIDKNYLRSLLWYSKAWLDDTYASRDESQHRMRMGSALSRLPALIGLCIHRTPIADAQLSMNTQRVLIRDGSTKAYLWNPFEGKELGEVDHGANLKFAAFSPDGKRVVTCGGSTAKLWDAQTLSLLKILEHPNEVNWADIRSDGTGIATACKDQSVRVWDATSVAETAMTLACHAEARFVQFSPDGTFLIATNSDGKLFAWKSKGGELLAENLSHQVSTNDNGINLPKFIANGAKLVTVGNGELGVWDTTTWKQLSSMQLATKVNDMDASDSGDRIVWATASAISRLVQIDESSAFESETAKKFDLMNPRQSRCAAISSDGSIAATSSSSGTVMLWNAADGTDLGSVRHIGAIARLRIVTLSDGSPCLFSVGEDGTVRLNQLNNTGVTQSPYQFDCGRSDQVTWLQQDDTKVFFRADAKVVFRATGNQGQLWERDTNSSFGDVVRHDRPIVHAAFSLDGRRLMTADDLEFVVRDAMSSKVCGAKIQGAKSLKRLQISRDGKRILAEREGLQFQIVDGETGKILLDNSGEAPAEVKAKSQAFAAMLATEKLDDAVLSPDGNYFLLRFSVSGRGFAYRIHDGENVLRTDFQKGVPAPISFSTDGHRFIIGNSDTRARVWDMRTLTAAGPMMMHPTFVRRTCISSNGVLAATHAADKQLRIWNAESGEILAVAGGLPPISKMWFSEDGKRVIVANREGETTELKIPEFQLAPEDIGPYLELLCCEHIDQTDGIAELEVDHFLKSPERFIRVWRSQCRSLTLSESGESRSTERGKR